jgi:hypothetical protein
MKALLLTALCFLAACAPKTTITYRMVGTWTVKGATCPMSFSTLNLKEDSTYITDQGQTGGYSIITQEINFNGSVYPLNWVDNTTLKLVQGTCEAVLQK